MQSDLVRLAVCDDIPRITDLVARLIAVSGIPQVVDRAYTQAVLARLIVSNEGAVWVTDGGFLAASIERSVINPEPIAVEHGWYAADRSGMRLLRVFEDWAAARSARVRLSTPARGVDLTRLGYRPVETAWVR